MKTVADASVRWSTCLALCIMGSVACADESPPALPTHDTTDFEFWSDVAPETIDATPVPTPEPFGLPPRLVNTQCRLDGDAGGGDPYEAVRVFPTLAFDEPADLVFAPGDPTRAYVQERPGRIRVVATDTGIGAPTPFLDLSARVVCCAEQGLLGFTFDPHFQDTGDFFVYYTLADPKRTRLSRFTVKHNQPDQADVASEQVLLEVPQPTTNHHGGMLAFGPDGYLYMTVGDGSGNFDLDEGFGQRLDDLNANILRLDVSASTPAAPYAIPPDNPFVGRSGARPEIWAYGFRNPWRISFDSDGTLWIGDVQEASYEEINIGKPGGNYGWNRMEASHCMIPPSDCDDGTLIPPTFEYPHGNGLCAIIGGFVYRGAAHPDLVGAYLYADHCTGHVWALRYENGQVIENRRIASTGLNLTSIARGLDGEVWFTSLTGGIYQLRTHEVTTTPSEFPATLSATHCFADLASRTPADGVIPYDLNAPLWSDGAHKRRWLVLPGVAPIGFTSDDFWDLPVGTILIKEFLVDGVADPAVSPSAADAGPARPIETRFLTKGDAGWKGYSYRWNDATATRMQSWYYPSRSDCGTCHNAAAGGSLGLQTGQLNRSYDYDGIVDNQLRAMEHIGLFGGSLPERPDALPRYVALTDESIPIETRVRSYLQSNCAHCHRPGGPSAAVMDLRVTTPLAATGMLDVAPTRGDLGIANPAIVRSGDPETSVLYQRMKVRGPNQMPPIASSVVDAQALDVVRRWIISLGAP